MRKVFALAVVGAVVVAGLFACGGSGGGSSSTDTTNADKLATMQGIWNITMLDNQDVTGKGITLDISNSAFTLNILLVCTATGDLTVDGDSVTFNINQTTNCSGPEVTVDQGSAHMTLTTLTDTAFEWLDEQHEQWKAQK